MSERLGWIRRALSGHFTHAGGSELDLQETLQISLSTLRFFRPLVRPVRLLMRIGLPLVPLAVYWAWTVTSAFSNGLLNARPLEPNQAFMLLLDSEHFVQREIESARGLGPASLAQVARAAGYAEEDLRVSGDNAQQSKDALKRELTPYVARLLPASLPSEVAWERGLVRRWEFGPVLSSEARQLLARNGLAALAIVFGCGAAGFLALRPRNGPLAAGVIVSLAAAPLGPFFLDASFGLLHGSPIQPATASFLRIHRSESVGAELAERRGLGPGVLEQAAQATGLAGRLVTYTWSEDGGEEPEGLASERDALLHEIARVHPGALPVEVRSRTEVAWRPRISAQLTPDARRQLRGHLVIFTLGTLATVGPLGIALVLYALRMLQEVNQGLRVDLMGRIQRLSLRHHAESHVGDAIYRLFQDSAAVLRLFASVIMAPVYHLSELLTSLFLLSLFSPWLSLCLVLILGPMLWIGWRASPALRRRFRTARETGSAVTSRIQETLAAIKVIKAYGVEPLEQARFERASEAAFEAAFAARTRLAGLGIVLFLISGVALIASDSGLALQAAAEHPTFLGAVIAFVGFGFWNLGAFTAARSRMRLGSRGIERLLITWARAQDQAVGMSRVLELLTREPEIQNLPDAVPLSHVTQGVAYQGVRFGYKDERAVLQGVEFGAAPGAVTAIVGPTGSGKSTLVSLLLRLYDPQAGSIQIDGRDLRRYDLESLRDRIGIALQQNLLFGTTVRENIRYAVPDASDEQVRAAARVACADEFIDALPLGYDTPLGERGTKLSTGQRQRLSIARALIKDPLILVLDEPTAALDAETELRVLERLSEWGRERVILLITHRLSTIRRAAQIVVLRDGRVAELGTPEALMARPGGLYRRFVEFEEGPASSEPPVPVAVSA